MRGSIAATIIISACVTGAGTVAATGSAFADSVSSAAGGGASVSIVTGANGGTTIVVNSDKPCRTENAGAADRTGAGTGSQHAQTRVDTGGGLSGSTTIGPNGQMSVNIHPGDGGSSATASAGSVQNKAAGGECVIVIERAGTSR